MNKQIIANAFRGIVGWLRGPSLVPVGLDERDAELLSCHVLLEETEPPGLARTVSVIGVVAVMLFLVWAGVTRFDEKAVAPGHVLPMRNVQPVQHLDGGQVAEVLVKEGDWVEQGAPLVVLDSTAPLAELNGLRARAAALAIEIERLKAFAMGRPADFGNHVSDYPDLVSEQAALLAAEIEARDAQLEVLDQQIAARRQELEGLTRREETLLKQVALFKEEVDMKKGLLDKGLTSKVVYLTTKRQANEAEGQLAEVRTEKARAAAAIAEAEGRRYELLQQLGSESLDRAGKLSAQLAEVTERMTEVEDRVRRTIVPAPIEGVVTGLAVTRAGAVVAPGDVIAEIVPTNDKIFAEVRIAPGDVGHVEPGLPALVKLEAYHFARYGAIEGRVERVSATSFADDDGNRYFKAMVSLSRQHLGDDPLMNRVTPGMTLVADIKTGEKSLLAYLTRPVFQALDSAFSER
ncbi:MAG: HlyD family type I secretion periplasmic adaptor subunit [Alphaproteobacteria bacterium]|nr:MAG: HlyD family type I secretion periplasmic adaptor subunit [Alphaproteobacteria bacterium]